MRRTAVAGTVIKSRDGFYFTNAEMGNANENSRSRSTWNNLYCTVSTMVLLVMMVLLLVLVMVAVMLVVPAATLVANPLPLLRPLLIVATAVFDDVQVTACVKSLLLNEFP